MWTVNPEVVGSSPTRGAEGNPRFAWGFLIQLLNKSICAVGGGGLFEEEWEHLADRLDERFAGADGAPIIDAVLSRIGSYPSTIPTSVWGPPNRT